MLYVVADVSDFVVWSAVMSAFSVLLRKFRKRYPTVQAFADVLHIAPSQLSRAMGTRGQPFDIAGCLRLAKITGTAPEVVLRAAGKHVIADLLVDFYGASSHVLSDEERRLLDDYSHIGNRHAQLSLLAIVAAMRNPHDVPSTSTPTAPTTPTATGTAWSPKIHARTAAGGNP
jgi:hypothetical protein